MVKITCLMTIMTYACNSGISYGRKSRTTCMYITEIIHHEVVKFRKAIIEKRNLALEIEVVSCEPLVHTLPCSLSYLPPPPQKIVGF